MSAADVQQTGQPRLSPAEARARAERLWRESVERGAPIAGSDLGPMVGRAPSWGRTLVRELRRDLERTGRLAPPTASNGADRQPTRPTVERQPARPAAGSRPEPQPARAVVDRQPTRAASGPSGSRPAVGNGPARQPAASTGSRPNRQPAAAATPAERWITTGAVLVVAAVAAVASWDHQRVLAEVAGEGWRSWMLPLSVDGLIVAASMSMLAARRAGQRVGWLPAISMMVGCAASLAANVCAAEPTTIGRLVAAWPPVALLLSHEMLLRQGRGRA